MLFEYNIPLHRRAYGARRVGEQLLAGKHLADGAQKTRVGLAVAPPSEIASGDLSHRASDCGIWGWKTKILYTTFCVLTLFGMVSSALYYGGAPSSTGASGVKSYYAGGARPGDAEPAPAVAPPAPPPAPGTPSSGPAIDVPDDESGHRPSSFRWSTAAAQGGAASIIRWIRCVLLIIGHLFLANGYARDARQAGMADRRRQQRHGAPRHALDRMRRRRRPGVPACHHGHRADAHDGRADAVPCLAVWRTKPTTHQTT